MSTQGNPTDHVAPGAALLCADACALLAGVHTRTWRRWAREGTAPAPVRLGRRALRWRGEDVAAFLDGRWTPAGGMRPEDTASVA